MEKINNLIWGGVGAILVVNGISYYMNKTISVQSVVIQISVVAIICGGVLFLKRKSK
ncbi:hypothetical protein KZO01_25500 [Kurthia zopfii]|uniref:Uncharacterized protein n=1 Tax=Kurthia zopfii TaxID=1650 RepID=A0A8B4Q9N9_9BACL|nr:hypothetical protein [Kurthia zopfii]TDR32701.1 hypothetical protein DFR61_1619 [Kurthia zopfii]GEK32241.1 hypothetical protein KZO01_25500 [Kurthia zopfii]STX09426.1 Uncharacterised protein [Kurthia zopfii]VEI06443.1 Uncharacterised protein [Kurthia zopfii]